MKSKNSIEELVIKYFKNNKNIDIPHGPVVDWVEKEYSKIYNRKPRDTWRAIRKLHEKGFLIKVKKGVYRYDPDIEKSIKIEDFNAEQKKQILQRDNYRCVICGRSSKEGYELHIDHILPKDKGGKATIDNAQTLCSICNFRKKNYNQTESGKKMFLRMLKKAREIGDKNTENFCQDVLTAYKKYHINDHIEWNQ